MKEPSDHYHVVESHWIDEIRGGLNLNSTAGPNRAALWTHDLPCAGDRSTMRSPSSADRRRNVQESGEGHRS